MCNSVIIAGPIHGLNTRLAALISQRAPSIRVTIWNVETATQPHDCLLYMVPLPLLPSIKDQQSTHSTHHNFENTIRTFQYNLDQDKKQGQIIQYICHQPAPSLTEQQTRHYFDGQLNILPAILAPTVRINQISNQISNQIQAPTGADPEILLPSDGFTTEASLDYLVYLFSATALTGQNFSIVAPSSSPALSPAIAPATAARQDPSFDRHT